MSDELIEKFISNRYSKKDIELAVSIIDKNLRAKSYREIKDMSFLIMKIAEDLCEY